MTLPASVTPQQLIDTITRVRPLQAHRFCAPRRGSTPNPHCKEIFITETFEACGTRRSCPSCSYLDMCLSFNAERQGKLLRCACLMSSAKERRADNDNRFASATLDALCFFLFAIHVLSKKRSTPSRSNAAVETAVTQLHRTEDVVLRGALHTRQVPQREAHDRRIS